MTTFGGWREGQSNLSYIEYQAIASEVQTFIKCTLYNEPEDLGTVKPCRASFSIYDNTIQLQVHSVRWTHRVIMYFIETKATSRLPYFGQLPLSIYQWSA
jgi:hypothetical protein